MKSLLCFLCLCSVANGQALAFTQNTFYTKVAGSSESSVYEDNVLKDTDSNSSIVPPTGFGSTQGLISSGNNPCFAFYSNDDGDHDASVNNATGWVLSSTITGNVYTAFIQAAGHHYLTCSTEGSAPKTIKSEAYSRAYSFIARSYTVTDPNKGSTQLVNGTITLKSIYLVSGLYPNHLNSFMHGNLGDNFVMAVANNNGWTVTRKLRTSSGVWENPTPPHLITTEEAEDFEVSYTCYAIAQGSFSSQAMYNTEPDGDLLTNVLDGNAIINGVSGQNPNISEDVSASVRVNINSVLRAFVF